MFHLFLAEGSREALLNVNQAAGRLGTLVRFVRRLVHERRVTYTKLGQHVRIEEADIDVFIAAGRVEPRVVNGRPEQAHLVCRRARGVPVGDGRRSDVCRVAAARDDWDAPR